MEHLPALDSFRRSRLHSSCLGRKTGHCLNVFSGHSSMAVNAAWLPNQRQIVSCDEGAQVRFWNWTEI